MSPAEIAAATLGIAAADILSVEPIKHGLTNESWLIRAADDAVVVRISNTSENELRIDRLSEARILSVVAAAGIGPDVLVCDPARRILVTHYLGATWSEDDAAQSANMERLADLLRRLHALTVPVGVRAVDLASTVSGYLRTLDAHDAQSSVNARSLRTRSLEIAAALRSDSRPCLCHNDVHHLNIVDGGTLRLIDWEYAGTGERLFDLASVCIYHRYDKNMREQLLHAYMRRPDLIAWHRLELACWLFDYIRDLWTAVRTLQRNSPS